MGDQVWVIWRDSIVSLQISLSIGGCFQMFMDKNRIKDKFVLVSKIF